MAKIEVSEVLKVDEVYIFDSEKECLAFGMGCEGT